MLIVLGLECPAPSKPTSDTVRVETRAFTPDGAPRGTQVQDAYIAVRPSTMAGVVEYEALSTIALKPGRYQLRVGAYSATNDRAGSVFADVEVPDFAKDAVSLSGVLLTSVPTIPASPLDVIAKLVPVVPTATRAFQRLDRVSAFARVYVGKGTPPADPAAAVTMRSTVMNDRGDLLLDQKETIDAARFTGTPRATDYKIDLPIVTLARGQYLLTIETARGKDTARREVRFSVK